jgi:uncharacterized protein YukE
MGRHTRVDVAAVRDAAGQFDASAEALDQIVRMHLSRLAFDGACAGRAYVGHGDALRNAIDQLIDELRQWSRASAEIAATLRSGADRYAEADNRNAARFG